MPLRQWEEIQEVLRASNGRLIAGIVIGFWLVMMALLVRREALIPHLTYDKVLAYQDRETDTWMGLYLSNDTCVGIVNTKTRPEVRTGEYGQTIQFWAKVSMTVLSFPAEIQLMGSAWAPRDRGLAEFEFSIRSGEHRMQAAAKIREGVLDGTLRTAGETIPLKFNVGKDLLFSGDMGTAALNVPGLEPGDELFVDTFDPMTLSVAKAKITCVGEAMTEDGGRQVPTKVIETVIGNVKSKAWVSHDNEVLRAETPFGFVMKKISQEQALQAIQTDKAASGDLLGIVAVRPTGKTPARGAARMRIRLSGLGEGVTPPEDDTQRVEQPGEYVVRVPEQPTAAGGPLLDDATKAAALKSDAFVQAGHPKIVAQAQEIVGDADDPWERALRIYEWVYQHINKTAVMSLPSALDVLETKEGDCNEHTVLFAALARAAGVPARIAIGVVWSDELEGFYYHAWPEVYVGRWTWMDPTLGQPVADATHIKLLAGSIEAWTQLVAYLGQLHIEVLEVETPSEAQAASTQQGVGPDNSRGEKK
jgi:hypothetical protein